MNPMRILPRNILLTLLLAISGAVSLTKYRPVWGFSLDAIFLSVGVLFLLQAAFIRRAHQEKLKPVQIPNSPYEAFLSEKDDIQPTQFGMAFILAAIAGLLSLIPLGTKAQSPPPPDQIHSLIQLLGKTESDLNECAKSKGSGNGFIPTDGGAMTEMREVLHRLEDILKSRPPAPQNPPPQNGASPWGTILIVFLALGAAGIIVGLTLKFAPSETPLAITAALVAGMIKGAKLLPQPGGSFYWYSIFGLLAVGGITALIATWRWKGAGQGTPKARLDTGTPPGTPGTVETSPPKGFRSRYLGLLFERSADHPDPNSPMVIGFSILLLACTLAYLGKAHDQSSPLPKPCPACPAVSSLRPTSEDWKPVVGFGERGRAAQTSDLGQFKRDLESRKFTEADLLLLLGSTDCVSISKNGTSGAASNQDLAARRANFVQGEASRLSLSSLPTIVTSAVPQAESCSKALERRAVYPLLFRPQAPK